MAQWARAPREGNVLFMMARFRLVRIELGCVGCLPMLDLGYGGRVGVGLCCLMTPGLSKDIQCHV